ncbi:hypothetical protein V7112_17075 [Bacillus sp. JJ1566]|uniref:hypothetical protein n=1 Tax=Bacillus sp. JJ1566 TaxID=3122961 RepID=UPI002FFE67EB
MMSVKNILNTSQHIFKELNEIIEQNNNGEFNYHISEIKYAIQLINNCIENDYADSIDVINELKNIQQKIYPPRGGLSDFFIWKSDYEERIKANEPFEKLSDELWQLLQQD